MPVVSGKERKSDRYIDFYASSDVPLGCQTATTTETTPMGYVVSIFCYLLAFVGWKGFSSTFHVRAFLSMRVQKVLDFD